MYQVKGRKKFNTAERDVLKYKTSCCLGQVNRFSSVLSYLSIFTILSQFQVFLLSVTTQIGVGVFSKIGSRTT
jgi:hypothetical protein